MGANLRLGFISLVDLKTNYNIIFRVCQAGAFTHPRLLQSPGDCKNAGGGWSNLVP
jgi:hypothetical protein